MAKNIATLREYAAIGALKNTTKEAFLTPASSAPKKLTYGNKAIAYGAMDSELEFYCAYPMTPASTILTEVVNAKRIPYLQAEDEIAVMNAALGASFTGARAMVGTS